jgi:urease accessory protein UreE
MEDSLEGKERHIVQGTIVVVQEQRFRLVTGGGQGLLLTLAANAPLDDGDLRRFQHEGTHVEVEYAGEPNLNSGIAYRIKSVLPALQA